MFYRSHEGSLRRRWQRTSIDAVELFIDTTQSVNMWRSECRCELDNLKEAYYVH